MKHLATICLIILTAFSSPAQQAMLQLKKTIPGRFQQISNDNLGNIYAISSNNRLIKYNAAGDSLCDYNKIARYGMLTTIDATNPFQVLLFYKNYATVVLLDRYFGVRQIIDLKALGITQVGAIGSSFDNAIWLFDLQDNKLKKINATGKVVFSTEDLRLILGKAIIPQKILDDKLYVNLIEKEGGIWQFDYFGNLKRTIPTNSWQEVYFANDFFYGTIADTLVKTSIITTETIKLPIPKNISKAKNLLLFNNKLLALKDRAIEIYEFIQK